jgi:hypothetical protein
MKLAGVFSERGNPGELLAWVSGKHGNRGEVRAGVSDDRGKSGKDPGNPGEEGARVPRKT